MQTELVNELGTNFIEYAAAVNSDRAIPDATSGLKPVARRILWGAFYGGYTSAKEHAKCARIVGDVMGRWHPHGDSSIYGALVRLSQPWVMRYPLIDFHGNMGNIGGDGPAAYRYTNARLAKLSEDGMLTNIKKNVVDFMSNYDENDEEPITLPSLFPNLLCNPNTGIGVAMACNWAPHNLTEVGAAIVDYLDGNEPTLAGPDFPTGGIIINAKDIPAIMATGHGSVKLRGRYKVEKQNIVFYEIPYGVALEDLRKEIGELSDTKAIEGIKDIRDESSRKGLRLVIECEKNVNPESVVVKLFAKSNLQTSFSYNQVALVNKTPTELNLKDCIRIYVEHNLQCIKRAAQFDLDKAKARLEIVEGLLKALVNIDEIIALIKRSESSAAAKESLISKYAFTENQAKAILDLKLAKLAKLEGIALENEHAELLDTIENLVLLIESEQKQKETLKRSLIALVQKYGDERRTELADIEIPKKDKEIAEVIPEDVVVVVSQSGNVKRIPTKNFKTQKRNGKGVKNEDEAMLAAISTNTIDALMLFTDLGKMYRLLVDKIPEGTMASRGANVSTILSMDANEHIIAATSLYHNSTAKYAVFFTKQGLIKKTSLEEYTSCKKSTGIAAIKLKDGDSLANVTFLNEEEVIVFTRGGYSIHFTTKDIAAIGRVTAGVKAVKLDDNDEIVIGLPIHANTDTVALVGINGLGKRVALTEFPVQGRGGKGVKASSVAIVGAAMVDDTDSLLIIGKPNNICINSTDIPALGRIAQGNQLVNGSKIERIVKL